MLHEINRRDLLKGGLAAASVALLAPLLKPVEAEAQIVSPLLTLAGYANPIVAFGTLLEAIWTTKQGAQNSAEAKARLIDIAKDIGTIASNQELILKQLADLRVVMREEIKQGFLNNDVSELVATSNQFRVALAGNDTQEIHSIASKMDNLAFKLPTYGLAAVPAYLSAVTLQNAAHFVLKSPLEVFKAINTTHHATLSNMLYGRGPETLSDLANRTSSTQGSTIDKTSPLLEFGKRYRFAVVSKAYDQPGDLWWTHASSYNFGYSYEGFKKGKPIFKRYDEDEVRGLLNDGHFGVKGDIDGKPLKAASMWFSDSSYVDYFSGKNIYTPFNMPEHVTLISVDAGGKAILEGTSLEKTQERLNKLASYYLGFYSPKFGLDITRETTTQPRNHPPDAAQKEMRRLLELGLQGVDRILAAARDGNLAAAPGFGAVAGRAAL